MPTEADERHLAYYFRDYITTPRTRSDVQVQFQAEAGDVEYLTAAAGRRSVRITTSDGRTEYLRGDATIHAATPLPPFTAEPLRGTVATIHAAAATPPDQQDAAVIIHGPSTSGKSSLVMALVGHGWGFLSDDTVPIDHQGRALPFTRPIGIRERTARRLGLNFDQLADAPQYPTTLGTTLSVHPRDLGWRIAQPAPVRWVVTLQPSPSFAAQKTGRRQLRLELDIERHETAAIDAIEELCCG
ncbi:hypothetical protein P9139_04565 [Curtobacterium flaccumfaciens]|nr:hypothetical protein P9139_04565 [Curtobacterium flaccumfaciens]